MKPWVGGILHPVLNSCSSRICRQRAWDQVLVLSPSSCVTWRQLLNISKPQFPPLRDRGNNNLGLLWRLNEMKQVNCLAQLLAESNGWMLVMMSTITIALLLVSWPDKASFQSGWVFFLRIRLCTTVAQSWAPISDKIGASLVAQSVKNLPAMQETLVRFLGKKKI